MNILLKSNNIRLIFFGITIKNQLILRLKSDSVSFKINLLFKITTVKLSSNFLILLVNLTFF